MSRSSWTVFALALVLLPLAAVAEPSRLDTLIHAPLARFTITATVAEVTPVIDGDLNDACWTRCTPYEHFTQALPNQEAAASESTVCYFAYDQHNFYFAAKCFDSEPAKIVGNLRRREDIGSDDVIQVMIDTYNDQRNGYIFLLNPFGVQSDGLKNIDGSDDSWDGVWTSAGKITANGWQVEAAIPFTTLRFPSKSQQVWRIQVWRVMQRKGEIDTYVPFRKTDNNDMERSAEMRGLRIENAQIPRNIAPYITNRYQKADHQRGENKAEVGLDLKQGIGSSAVVDATLNPDFSQIEADLDYINLTPYALYLQEKRPFFLEKADIFATPFNLFYSRRIEDPDWGLKFTGKQGAYGFGLLYAQDNNSTTQYKDQYVVARGERTIMAQSHVGFMGTWLRNVSEHNGTAAIDWRLLRSPLSFSGQLAKSSTTGRAGLDWKGIFEVAFVRNNLSASFSHALYERNFAAYAGFVYPVVVDLTYTPLSYRTESGKLQYTLYINRPGLQSLSPSVGLTLRHDYDGRLLERTASPTIGIAFSGTMNIGLGSTFQELLWQDTYFHVFVPFLSCNAKVGTKVTFSTYYSEGQELNYWASISVWQRYLSAQISLNPSAKVEVIPSVFHMSQYEYQHGPRTYNQWNGALRLGFQFSKELFFKMFAQGNGSDDSYMGNFLLGYTFRPGSTAYLAYNSNYHYDVHKLVTDDRILFAKILVLFNP